MWRGLRLVVVLSMCLQLAAMAVGPSSAYAADVAEPIASFVRRLDDLAYFEELGEPIPFTIVSPSDERALRLGGLLRDLADRLESGDTSSNKYQYGDVSVEVQWPTSIDLTLSFTATRVLTAPITLSLEDPASSAPGLCNDSIDNHGEDPADGSDQDDTDCSYIGYLLNGGGITTRLELAGEFVFASEDDELYLAQPPAMTLSIQDENSDEESDVVLFEDQFGFADVDVMGQADLDEVITLTFEDPDDDGRITETEWTLTAIEDLTMVGYDPGSTVSVSLALESSLLGPDEVGTIELNLDRSVDPDWPINTVLSFPEPLRKFTNIDSDKALAGLNSYAVSLNAALLAGEVQLPFLDKHFSDVFSPGDSIVELVKQQTDALVICGKTDTLPPTGDPIHADPLYCQAITYADPTEVITWTLENATLEYSGLLTETVGVSPQKNVKFQRESTGERPRARVEFRDADGLSHTVFPRVLSAQQLKDELAKKLSDDELASGMVTVHFDPDSSALMYDISMEISPPMTTTQFAFADQLRQATHLANLRSAAENDPEMRFTNVVLSSTFGILLLDDDEVGELPPGQEQTQDDCDDGDDNDQDGLTDGYDPDCPAPNGPDDRFFLVPSDDPAIAVNNLVLTNTNGVTLTGNIGFLGVSATGPFTLTKGNHGDNILEIDIKSGDDYGEITNAIRIREFLADSKEQVTSTVNLTTTASLQVKSEGLSELLTGNVNVAWDLAESESPTIEPDPNFSTNLRPFDIAPTLTGVYAQADPSPVLIDPTRDFVADLN